VPTDEQIWWRLNLALLSRVVLVAIILGLRFYFIYKRAKNAPKRSPRVRRIEVIVAITLWSFIVLGVAFLLLTQRLR
jgi:heme/copper-type cytochrome/quinol oxidase subunit 2